MRKKIQTEINFAVKFEGDTTPHTPKHFKEDESVKISGYYAKSQTSWYYNFTSDITKANLYKSKDGAMRMIKKVRKRIMYKDLRPSVVKVMKTTELVEL